jgi:succinate-acetate transporter protein
MASASEAATHQQTLIASNTGSIADPGPLGLAGFAMTTFVLSVFNANLVKTPGLSAVVLPLALYYGGGAQLLAGMWEFRKANTFGALAFTSYGAFWLAFAYYVQHIAGGFTAHANEATGLFLLAWTIFTAYMTIAAVKVNGAVLTVFVLLTATFLLLTIGALGNHTGITHVGGWFGLATALAAWYASLAGVTNATWGRVVFPVFPANR